MGVGFRKYNLTGSLTTCWILLPILVTVSIVYRESLSNIFNLAAQSVNSQVGKGSGNIQSNSAAATEDKLLGGLLPSEFDQTTCISRYQSSTYRKPSPHKPSPYLIQKLHNYEALHKKCGPKTKLYNKSEDQLKSGHNNQTLECNYVIWIPISGLGNRILTLASTFLYALLTNRVLLIERGKDVNELFCEPFPGTSWLLPLDFPLLDQFKILGLKSEYSFGSMIRNHVLSESIKRSFPVSTYIHLLHDYRYHDMLFFCEEYQKILGKISWLTFRSNIYFTPSLFTIPSFEQELVKLFPEKDTVFHHLGRYLLHPSNSVWGLISRFYDEYLANADEKLGLQIRVFQKNKLTFSSDQVVACALNHSLLPPVSQQARVPLTQSYKTKAVLLTSLSSQYYENIKNMYWEKPTVNGEKISVFQPSHEEVQQTEKKLHDMKALAEVYLLSLMDILVTSSQSTFGYVAQGLGGLTPWILIKPENDTVLPDPPCRRAMSMEACFHAAPTYYCKAKRDILPYIRQCEDTKLGIKLVNLGNH